MTARVSIVSIAVLVTSAVVNGAAPSGMPLPAPATELAAAIGLSRADTANLPIDLVRSLYGSTDVNSPAHAAVRRLLTNGAGGSDRVALPLGADVWRQRILGENIPDDRLAAAIFGRRAFALIYHGLLGVDAETLEWLAGHPAALEHFKAHPGAAAVFARSVHVRGGVVATPGENAASLWSALVGADPSRPEAFIGRLFDARGGRLAYLFDTVMHLDGAHQKFALAPARGEAATARARALLDVVSDSSPTWRVDERPFMRPDVDAAQLLRLVAVTDEGTMEGSRSRAMWERAFGDRLDAGLDANGGPSIDAAWLAGKILRPPAMVGRQRLDLFLMAQRVLPDAASSPSRALEALRGFNRYPALAATLERNGVRGVDAYAAAEHAAATMQQDQESLALGQSLLGIVDGARAAGTLTRAKAGQLATALLDLAGSTRQSASSMTKWISASLLPELRVATASASAGPETIVMNALGGPSTTTAAVSWEEHTYRVDAAAGERRRIERIRRTQEEAPLDRALANATTTQGVRELTDSLTALLYAVALGDPDGQAAEGGTVWRRHRFKPEATPEGTSWRIAVESFGSGGWHLTGSLLALDAAMPRLALRRLDMSRVPLPTQLSTSDRRTLALTIALMERPPLTDEDQQSIAAAIARGRERVRSLTADPSAAAALVRDAGLSEWRANGVLWMLAADPSRVAPLFTLTDLYRLGRTRPDSTAWGGAALALDGSIVLRPIADAWEDYTGHPSTGQLGSQFVDVQLRTAEALVEFRLPASIARDVAAFAMQDVLDLAAPAYFDDFLSLAFTARDLDRGRFEDYVSALTAAGPLVPAAAGIVTRH